MSVGDYEWMSTSVHVSEGEKLIRNKNIPPIISIPQKKHILQKFWKTKQNKKKDKKQEQGIGHDLLREHSVTLWDRSEDWDFNEGTKVCFQVSDGRTLGKNTDTQQPQSSHCLTNVSLPKLHKLHQFTCWISTGISEAEM